MHRARILSVGLAAFSLALGVGACGAPVATSDPPVAISTSVLMEAASIFASAFQLFGFLGS